MEQGHKGGACQGSNVTDLFPCWRLKDAAELCCLWVFRHLPARQMTTENHKTHFLMSRQERGPSSARDISNTARITYNHCSQNFKRGVGSIEVVEGGAAPPSLPPTKRQLASIIYSPLSPACLSVGHQRAVPHQTNIWPYFSPYDISWPRLCKATGVRCDPIYTWLHLAKQYGSPGNGSPS